MEAGYNNFENKRLIVLTNFSGMYVRETLSLQVHTPKDLLIKEI